MKERYIFGLPGEIGESDAPGGDVWISVGCRLQRKRAELGYSAEDVAEQTGIPVESYEDYECGVPIPASLLAQVAELFDTPVVWFFEGATNNEASAANDEPDIQPVTYTVATIEHRIQALADTFRRLDFEGQQHLLAISQALSRAARN